MTYEQILASLESRFKIQEARVRDLERALQLARDLGEDVSDEQIAVDQARAELKHVADVIAKHKATLGKK